MKNVSRLMSATSPSTLPSPWMQEKPIGQALRDAYKDVLNEPVPARFTSLIEKLREEERRKGK